MNREQCNIVELEVRSEWPSVCVRNVLFWVVSSASSAQLALITFLITSSIHALRSDPGRRQLTVTQDSAAPNPTHVLKTTTDILDSSTWMKLQVLWLKLKTSQESNDVYYPLDVNFDKLISFTRNTSQYGDGTFLQNAWNPKFNKFISKLKSNSIFG